MDGPTTPPETVAREPRGDLEATAAGSPTAATLARPTAGQRQVFLPSEVDPTVFDEGFLRQLERLLVLMRSPVRGGLKGGRRSVKRGQSDRKSTRLNSSHIQKSRMPSSA